MSVEKVIATGFSLIIGAIQNQNSEEPAQQQNGLGDLESLFGNLAESSGLDTAALQQTAGDQAEMLSDKMVGPLTDMAETAINDRLEEQGN